MFTIEVIDKNTSVGIIKYKANIVPTVKDVLLIKGKSYKIVERWIFPENESYFHISVIENSL